MKFLQVLVYLFILLGMTALSGWAVSVIVQIGFWKAVAAAFIVYIFTLMTNQVIKFVGEL